MYCPTLADFTGGGNRGGHGQRHADDAVPDRALGLFLVRQAAQGQDEQHGGDHVGRADQSVVDQCMIHAPQDRWNMASMRRVTRNPRRY
jgi:hypothetical protein